MARCTAPVKGHHSASAAANCPVCRYKSYGYSSYPSNYTSYKSPSISNINSASSVNYNISKGRTIKPLWSNSKSSIYYTLSEVRTLTPIEKMLKGEL
jgi:hypothetical protein